MTPELDQHIREKYPLIFSGRCEISIGDGWFDIIDLLCANIQGHIDDIAGLREHTIKWNEKVNDPNVAWSAEPYFIKREERPVTELVEQVVATQIKEKFGGLRFYYYGGDDYIRGLETMASAIASVSCEDCGSPGAAISTEKKRWVRVLCEKHAYEQGYVEDSD